MTKTDLVKLARELYLRHGLLSVPVHGKIPIGGEGWNHLTFDDRLVLIDSPQCTGIGIQCGLIFHPKLGPVEARVADCDIDDRPKLEAFASALQGHIVDIHEWRWGRRPATLLFTQPGIITNEKFGPIQLLGSGKQAVWYGEYKNKDPVNTDPKEYWHQGESILTKLPPLVPAGILKHALEASLAAAGIAMPPRSMLIDAKPLSTHDIAILTPDYLATFKADIKSVLLDVQNQPQGTGRGNKLHTLGIKYGALIKASGQAPMLMQGMRAVCKEEQLVEFDLVINPILFEIGTIAESAFAILPGTLGHGDKRDFARGVGKSMGLSQFVAVEKSKHPLTVPSGRDYPGQHIDDLMQETYLPVRYLVDRYLVDSGCIVFAGKPKVGKGWIILELALCVAVGTSFWGENCARAEVVMYMLEDSKRRVRHRLETLRPSGIGTGTIRFRYGIDGPFYVNSDGTGTLLDDIKNHIRSFPGTKLVVIDTLQRVRGTVDKSDNAYQMDYKVVAAIQKLAVENNVLIIIIHHTRKGKSDDVIDSVNGSFGLSGASDGVIVIGKNGSDHMTVSADMRDIPGYDFELIKEENSPVWKPAQTVQELFAPAEGTKTSAVLLALHAAACTLTAGDISVRTSIPENQVASYLVRLVKSHQIVKTSRGYYMASGLPLRDRIDGVIDILKRCKKTPATAEIKANFAPNSAPPDATFMLMTGPTLVEIEAGFVRAKETLSALKHRGKLTFNNDTIWLIGDEWASQHHAREGNPFQQRYPWEMAT